MSVFYPFTLRSALPYLTLGPLLLVSSQGWGQIVRTDTTIDSTTPLDNYRVTGTATLTANNAKTQEIRLENNTKLVLDGSQVSATGSAAAIRLDGAEATLGGSEVVAERQALTAGLNSRANVIDSLVSGGTAGAVINNSVLTLHNSKVLGTGANAVGMNLFDGEVQASADSSIVGEQDGIRVRGDTGQPAAKAIVRLDGSQVEGRNGSAISVGVTGSSPARADIEVNQGSTLKAGNGTLVDVGAVGTADIRVSASALEGDIVVAEGGYATLTLADQATLKGRLDNLERLDLNSAGQWTLVDNAQLNTLAMNGGAVALSDSEAFHALQLGSLTGNGTFIMKVDFASGAGDQLKVTGNATGDHQIRVTSTGNDPTADSELRLVETAAGSDARFSLEGGPVDLGTFAYGLTQRGNDWFLDASLPSLSNGTKTILALANTAPTVWYGELTTLRSRMGEVRRNEGAAGGWMRSYGNQYNASASGFGYKQQQQGLSVGADGRLPVGDGNWLAGLTAGYSTSDLDLQGGSSGKVDSYHIGAYTTWLDPHTGYYVDGVAKLNRYRNRADVQLSDGSKTQGDYSTNGVGVSLEAGRHIKLGNGYFLEPYAQLAAMAIEGQSYQLDNGLQANGDVTRSLQGKLGATAGRTFDYGQGRMLQPYVRLAGAHEFVNNNRLKVNDNTLNNDLAGSRAELGAGVVAAWNDRWQVRAEFDYADGERLQQPWGASVGVRYNW